MNSTLKEKVTQCLKETIERIDSFSENELKEIDSCLTHLSEPPDPELIELLIQGLVFKHCQDIVGDKQE